MTIDEYINIDIKCCTIISITNIGTIRGAKNLQEHRSVAAPSGLVLFLGSPKCIDKTFAKKEHI